MRFFAGEEFSEIEGLVVHRNKAKFDLYVGRPGKWGNPYLIGTDGTREEVIRKYIKWLRASPKLVAELPTLRGQVLACWCAPLDCHAHVLALVANSSDPSRSLDALDGLFR